MSNIVTNRELSELYTNYKPAYDNLYKVEIFSADGYAFAPGVNDINLTNYISFHTYSVSFNGESLSLERDALTKRFKLKTSNSYSRTDTLTLGWRENVSWEVKQYHDNWLAKFYNRETDNYISYDKEPESRNSANAQLYRNIRVTLMNEEQDESKYKYVIFKNVLPNTTGGISLGWKETPSIVSHSITYYVTEWELLSYKEYIPRLAQSSSVELYSNGSEEINENILLNNSSPSELQKSAQYPITSVILNNQEERFNKSVINSSSSSNETEGSTPLGKTDFLLKKGEDRINSGIVVRERSDEERRNEYFLNKQAEIFNSKFSSKK